MDQLRQSLTLDIYLIDMFTTILNCKYDQINKIDRPKCENKMQSKFYLEPQSLLAYPTSKALKIERNKHNL
jgi:hypothetical protein